MAAPVHVRFSKGSFSFHHDTDLLPNHHPPSDSRRRRNGPLTGSTSTTIPRLRSLYRVSALRYGRRRAFALILCLFIAVLLLLFMRSRRQSKQPEVYSSTLVYRKSDLQRIWHWEIASGHHPSRRKVPTAIELNPMPKNPALPPSPLFLSNAVGPRRIYVDLQSQPSNIAYSPRPVPNSIVDLDILLAHCDFSMSKYVRDCLEVLRVAAGLDNGKRVRSIVPKDWYYIFVEFNITTHPTLEDLPAPMVPLVERGPLGFPKETIIDETRKVDLEEPLLLPPLKSHSDLPEPTSCDPDDPHIFHMYWTGPFTDKPYLAILSFLFTQNIHPPTASACPPKMWLWVNPVPAAATPPANAEQKLFEQLRTNQWASPFLAPRFKDIVQFKFWNTTEQLDGVAELRDEWRKMDSLFVSGGYALGEQVSNDLTNRTGSKSAQEYDRLSVVMSDVARFILCHRFGGIYLDADTVFLRDWEELWGWKGAFAYRWSYHDKHNTAVLRLRRQSALGTFILRTALKNAFDFHPMSVSTYLRDARLDELLFRLPDALFDAAWLNMEGFQRERPPQPYFVGFDEFFVTPSVDAAAPQALGFEGFFQGSFSYHFHNSWWTSVDPSRNWPDLSDGSPPEPTATIELADTTQNATEPIKVEQRDLSWAAVLKRTFESYMRGERPNMYGEWIPAS
ncbi:snoRNA binding protein [Mycena floridula]|nr:snoRNA binding protein [Mycena floridula]